MNLHARDRCVFCNSSSARSPLRSIVFHRTEQPAAACVDVVACVRRQARRKRIRLEGRAPLRRLTANETYFKRGAA